MGDRVSFCEQFVLLPTSLNVLSFSVYSKGLFIINCLLQRIKRNLVGENDLGIIGRRVRRSCRKGGLFEFIMK